MGCLMNIQGMLSRKGTDIRVMHIAQLLANSQIS
jgi:Fe-S oxidoreductase